MTSPQRRQGRVRAPLMAAATALAVIFLSSIGGAAQAADPVVIKLTANTESPVEFGSDWSFSAKLDRTRCGYRNCNDSLILTFTGDNGTTVVGKADVYGDENAYFSSFELEDSLPAGTYTITSKFKDPWGAKTVLSSANNAPKLTINPAPVAVDFRVETDPHQPTGAIVNAQLTGVFLDGIAACLGSVPCHEPLASGTWDFAITDESGAVLVEKQIAAKGPASQFASFYWHNVPAGSNFTGTAKFTFAGTIGKSFVIEQAADVAFTSPAAVAAGEPGSVEVPAVTEEPETGPSLPFWAILAWIVVMALLAVAVTVFAILALRQRRAATSIDSDSAVSTGELSKADHS